MKFKNKENNKGKNDPELSFLLDVALPCQKEMDELLCKFLWCILMSMGAFQKKKVTLSDIKSSAGIIDTYDKWLVQSMRFFQEYKYLESDGTVFRINDSSVLKIEDIWNEWNTKKSLWIKKGEQKYHVDLLEAVIPGLAKILTGALPGTEVIFPNSSMELVEGIYKHNRTADYFNNTLADIIVNYIEDRKKRDSSVKINIFEIGSGTGGTSEIVLKKLKKYHSNINEFYYTDLSRAFLLHGEENYGKENPFLVYKIFNVGKPVAEQGIEIGSYDIVFATNVLHATKDISETLRNCKALLKTNGILLLNEMIATSLFLHMTFGFLDGWWLFEDTNSRIPGCPLLSPEIWNRVLTSEGFFQIFFPVENASSLGQQVVAASSNGIIRQKQSSGQVKKNLEAREKVKSPHKTTIEKKSNNDRDNNISDFDLKEKSVQFIKKLVADVLKYPVSRINTVESLDKYGIDSILVIQLTNSFKKCFDNVKSTLFFEYQTINDLTSYFIKTQRSRLIELTGSEEKIPEKIPEKIETPSEIIDLTEKKKSRLQYNKDSSHQLAISEQLTSGDIAIVGLSGRYPKAKNINEFWENLKSGLNCISEIPESRWDWSAYFDETKGIPGKMYSKWGGFIEDIDKFDPLFFNITPLEAEKMDPQARLFLEESYHCLEDAGYTPASLSTMKKVGVFAGVMNGYYASGANYWSIANRISYHFNFHGPSMAIDTACSSSLVAIHLACESIKNGSCECAIAGGVNLIVDPEHYISLSTATMISRGNKNRTFGIHADGFVDGEAIGVVLLKPLSKAVIDGDHIYGVIKGSAINAGGKTNGFTVPNPVAQKDLVKQAIQNSGVNPRSITYIEAHGTGTELGDPIEISALTKAFEFFTRDKGFCSIGSVKSNIGHTESAAGIAGLTKILLQMKHKQLVPSLHTEELNPEIDFNEIPFFVQKECGEWESEGKRIAGISSFGAGGANVHLIVEEYIPEQESKAAPSFETTPFIFVLSAKNSDRLKQKAKEILEEIEKQGLTDHTLASIAYTLQTGRESMEERFGFTAMTIKEVKRKINAYLNSETLGEIFSGNIKQNRDTILMFDDFDEMISLNSLRSEHTEAVETALKKWIKNKNYKRVIDLWIKGLDLDWKRLYRSNVPKKMSLPGYPFSKTSYWIDKADKGFYSATGSGKSLHPLVHENTSSFTEQRFSSVFTGEEPFFTDHQVLGKKVLPGVAYLEMARVALKNAADLSESNGTMISLQNVVWARPFIINENPLKLNIALLLAAKNTVEYEVYSKDSTDTLVIHSQGMGKILPKQENITIDLEAVRNLKWDDSLTGEDFYKHFDDMGIQYGQSFRCINSVHISEKKVLAHLALPDSCQTGHTEYFLHPSLLDSAFQAVVGFMINRKTDGNALLPFALAEIKIFKKSVLSMWAVCTEIVDGNMGKYNIDLCDDAGVLCVRVTGLAVREFKTKDIRITRKESVLKVTPSGTKKAPEKNAQPDMIEVKTVAYFLKFFSTTLKIPEDQIEPETPFEKYGIDSIMTVQLTNKLEKIFGTLDKTLFFEYNTINRVAAYFLKTFTNKMQDILDLSRQAPGSEQKSEEGDISIDTVDDLLSGLKAIKTRRFAAGSGYINSMQNMDMAIIGISGRYAGAKSLDDFWNNLTAGKNCITEVPPERWNWKDYYDEDKNKHGIIYHKWGGFLDGVDEFDPLFFNIAPREAEILDPQERLFLECAYSTMEDAGYTREPFTTDAINNFGRNVGVFVGVMWEEYQLYGAQAQTRGDKFAIGGNPSSIANRVSYAFNFNGPSMAVDSMCSSALTAIHLACQSISQGDCEMAIAGGVNISIHPNKYLLLSERKYVSSDGKNRSFGKGGDGYVPGEGVGSVLLKSLDKAISDGDHIYGVIKSSCLNAGGRTNGFTVPNPAAQGEVIRRAIEKAGIDARSISYIEAHGTGTSLGDPIEIKGLTKAFRHFTEDTGFCSIGSVKSNIGHCEAAAGIASLSKVLLQMKYKKLVPSLNSGELNPNINFENTPFVVQQTLSDWKSETSRIAGISAFGAGGANAHLIIEEFQNGETAKTSDVNKNGPFIILLSASDKERLVARAKDLLSKIESENYDDDVLADIAYTLQTGRESMEERLGFIVNTMAEMKTRLLSFINGDPDSALFIGKIARNTKIISLFSSFEEMQEVVTKLITNKQREKLIHLWVNGLKIDWNKLYDNKKCKKMSLPAYRFLHQKYWIGMRKTKHDGVQTQETKKVDKPVISEMKKTLIQTGKKVESTSPVKKKPVNVSLSDVHTISMNDTISANQKKSTVTLTELTSPVQIIKQEKAIKEEPPKKNLPLVSHGELCNELMTLLAKALYVDESVIDIDKKFIDLGLDSIIGIEWIKTINKRFGTNLIATRVYDYPCVREFANFLFEELKKSGEASINFSTGSENIEEDSIVSQQTPELSVPEIAGKINRDNDKNEADDISLEMLYSHLTRMLAEALYVDESHIDINKKFIDLGLDSIIGIEWIKSINKKYGINIIATRIYDYPCISEFAEFLKKELEISGYKPSPGILRPEEKKQDLSEIEVLRQLYEGNMDVEGAYNKIK